MIYIRTRTLQKSVMTATLVLLSLGALQASADEAVDAALRKCAGIADDQSRLSCYDALATVLVTEPSDVVATESMVDPVAEPVAETTAAAAATAASATAVVVDTASPTPLTDDVGKERIEPTSAEEKPRFGAHVTACQKSVQSGQYYFTFENGQIWKQTNYRSLNFRDCDFEVEIAKQALGYEMYIPSKDRTVRVGRIK